MSELLHVNFRGNELTEPLLSLSKYLFSPFIIAIMRSSVLILSDFGTESLNKLRLSSTNVSDIK